MTDSNIKNTAFSDIVSDALSTAVIVLNIKLNIQHMNAAAENLFGKSRARVIDKPYSFLLNAEMVDEHLQVVLKTDEPQILRGCYLKDKYQESVTLDCVANPLLKTRKLHGIVLELHRKDYQLRISREEQLLNQQEATQVLMRGMAHEIKNPLGGIRGAAQLLESEFENN